MSTDQLKTMPFNDHTNCLKGTSPLLPPLLYASTMLQHVASGCLFHQIDETLEVDNHATYEVPQSS